MRLSHHAILAELACRQARVLVHPPMRLTVLGYGLCLGLVAAADAGELWTVSAEVPVVTVRIHWVSRAELLETARNLGKRPQTTALAFSVLRENVATGDYVCDVYMLKQPVRVWDEPTASLGHELAHCLGFVHK